MGLVEVVEMGFSGFSGCLGLVVCFLLIDVELFFYFEDLSLVRIWDF